MRQNRLALVSAPSTGLPRRSQDSPPCSASNLDIKSLFRQPSGLSSGPPQAQERRWMAAVDAGPARCRPPPTPPRTGRYSGLTCNCAARRVLVPLPVLFLQTALRPHTTRGGTLHYPLPTQWRLGHPPLVEAGDTKAVRVLATRACEVGWRGGIGLARVVGSVERTGNKTEVRIGLGVLPAPARIVRAAPPSPTPFPVARLEKQIAWQLPRSIGFSLLFPLHPLCKRHHLIPILLNVVSWRVCSTVPQFFPASTFVFHPSSLTKFPPPWPTCAYLLSASPIQHTKYSRGWIGSIASLYAMLFLSQGSCVTNA